MNKFIKLIIISIIVTFLIIGTVFSAQGFNVRGNKYFLNKSSFPFYIYNAFNFSPPQDACKKKFLILRESCRRKLFLPPLPPQPSPLPTSPPPSSAVTAIAGSTPIQSLQSLLVL